MNIPTDDPVSRHAVEFARRLRTLRERGGLTQGELGRRAGLTAAAISQLETGERRPNFATLVRLAEGLEVTLDGLVGMERRDGADAGLAGLVRELEGMEAADLRAVRAFVRWLREEKST